MTRVLRVKDLEVCFATTEGTVQVLDGVSFDIRKGEVLGVVGESGCGKSVTALSILGLLGSKGKITNGEITLYQDDGEVELSKLDPSGPMIRKIRGKEISMIFQEPMTSFSPVYTIGNQIMEVIRHHQGLSKKAAREAAVEMLGKVRIPHPEQRIDAYPHQLSGGMRQRAMIAMALSCRPRILIADEPTTALDVTIQAQILRLMRQLKDEMDTSIMLITHNLGVIGEMADRVVVMYMGRIVESLPVKRLFEESLHPYTQALLMSLPVLGSKKRNERKRLASIKGMVPDISRVPPGCPFHPRCDRFMNGLCNVHKPRPVQISPDHEVSCLLYSEVAKDAG